MGCPRAVSSCVIPVSSMKPLSASIRSPTSANTNTLFSAASISRGCWRQTESHWVDIRQKPRRACCRIHKFNSRQHYSRHKAPLHLPRASKRGRESMTPQERQLIDDLFDRLSKLESAPRDPDAVAAISQGLRKAPNAVYPLVQTVLLQDEALKRANSRIQELEAACKGEQRQSGGFLDSMRDAIFGQEQPRGSVPNVPPPTPNPPGGHTGQAMQQSQPPGPYGQGPPNTPPPPNHPY